MVTWECNPNLIFFISIRYKSKEREIIETNDHGTPSPSNFFQMKHCVISEKLNKENFQLKNRREMKQTLSKLVFLLVLMIMNLL
jgi:hypothetical protein